MIIFIQQIKDSIHNNSDQLLVESHMVNNNDFNWWIVISMVELLLILILLIRFLRTKHKPMNNPENFNDLKKAKSSEIDMTNLINSINSSRDIYKELSRKCHPDKFQDELMKNKADKIFQDISRYKRDYAKLIELKRLAEDDLNINF